MREGRGELAWLGFTVGLWERLDVGAPMLARRVLSQLAWWRLRRRMRRDLLEHDDPQAEQPGELDKQIGELDRIAFERDAQSHDPRADLRVVLGEAGHELDGGHVLVAHSHVRLASSAWRRASVARP